MKTSFLLVILFVCNLAVAYTPNDTLKTIATDGSYSDFTNAQAYVNGKATNGWMITVGSGGTYVWTAPNEMVIAPDYVSGNTGMPYDLTINGNGSTLVFTNVGLTGSGHPQVSAGGFVTNVVLDFSGNGYYSYVPAVAVIDSTGTNAVITATVVNQKITGFVVDNPGSNYSQSASLAVQSAPAMTQNIYLYSQGGFLTLSNFTLREQGLTAGNSFFFINSYGPRANCFRLSNLSVVKGFSGWNGIIGNGDRLPFLGPWGVIDHCDFTSASYSTELFLCRQHSGAMAWTNNLYFGTTNCVVFEDCSFTATNNNVNCVNFQNGGIGTFRHCNFTNVWEGNHGAPSGEGYSGVSVEFYQNNSTWDNRAGGESFNFRLRGGTGLIWSNTTSVTATGGNPSDLTYVYAFQCECAGPDWLSEGCLAYTNAPYNDHAPLLYPNDYPFLQQVGRGVANMMETNMPIYMWGNTVVGPGTITAMCKLGQSTNEENFVLQGRDIFTNTPLPGYVPLVYPHPLITASPATPVSGPGSYVPWWRRPL